MSAELLVIAAAGAVHVLGVALAAGKARGRGRRLSPAVLLFCLLLPGCGTAACWVMALAPKPDDDAISHLRRNEKRYEQLMAQDSGAARIVPLEEAFLINAPQKRRELMLSLLRSDPRKYLDLLLLARFNEDPETAHYATATLTEVQRQIQLELQQAQLEAVRHPQDAAVCSSYIRQLRDYVESGLLEGHLLERQRMVLEQAFDSFPAAGLTPELMKIRVGNLLELRRPAEARGCAERMIGLWPQDETGWLALLHVCVDTRDPKGLQALLERAQGANVEWSRTGLERMKYFGRRNECGPAAQAAGEGEDA